MGGHRDDDQCQEPRLRSCRCRARLSGALHAQIGVGTWVRQSTASMPGTVTMTVEACCNGGRRLIYHIVIGDTKTLLTVESRLDGSDAPVMMEGKPSNEMQVDGHERGLTSAAP